MSDTNLAIIMVGSPATGKSFTSRNLSRYLRWLGIETFTFSAAKYRQEMFHGQQIRADFFDASNSEFLEQRTRVADTTLYDMVNWFSFHQNNNLKVAIMDASNTIQSRRQIIKTALEAINVNVIFIECVYETEGLLNEHLPFLHLLSPDYEKLNSEIAQEDYKQRIKYYRHNYEPVNETDGSFIKLINGGQQVIVNKVTGFLPSKVIFYLINLHFGHKKIFLQVYNPQNQNQNDVIAHCKELVRNYNPDKLVTWAFPDLSNVSSPVEYKTQLTALNMANLEGLSQQEISQMYPEEAIKHEQNPYKHRYPRCESYSDLSRRLETVMMELERVKDNVLIIADLSVIRCIYAYFVETSNPNLISVLEFDSNELIEFVPQAYGCFETRYIGTEASREKTFRPYMDHPPSSNASPKIITSNK